MTLRNQFLNLHTKTYSSFSSFPSSVLQSFFFRFASKLSSMLRFGVLESPSHGFCNNGKRTRWYQRHWKQHRFKGLGLFIIYHLYIIKLNEKIIRDNRPEGSKYIKVVKSDVYVLLLQHTANDLEFHIDEK